RNFIWKLAIASQALTRKTFQKQRRVVKGPPGTSLTVMTIQKLLRWCVLFLLPLAASAHVNSPDVYYDGNAGPYHLLVTVRPPSVVPGIAQIDIRSANPGVERVEIVPLRMTGPGAKLAPTADAAERFSSDPQSFHGKLWIMGRGSWKVNVKATGK